MFDGLGLLVATMLSCSAGTPETDKQAHCYVGLATGTWTTILTKNPYFGGGLGCALGAVKEISDKQGGGVADKYDFAYTCAASILSSYASKNIIVYYENRPMVGYRIKF